MPIRVRSRWFPTSRIPTLRPQILIATAATISLTSIANAQWTVTNLSPVGATNSVAWSTAGTGQAGYADIGGVLRAVTWSGSFASFVDLNPTGAAESIVYATNGTQHAGYASLGGVVQAGIWSGTASSWEALPLPLTASWDFTVTNSIWSDATTLYVAGYGANSGTSNEKAFLSTRANPTPGAASVLALGGLLATRRRPRGYR